MRVIGVDWSGAKNRSTARRAIWLAEVRHGDLIRLEDGRDRGELIEHLIQLAAPDDELIIGLDFAFSFPAWFLEKRGLETAADTWRRAGDEGEEWLAECPPPFWGQRGTKRPDLPAVFRATEERPADVDRVGTRASGA